MNHPPGRGHGRRNGRSTSGYQRNPPPPLQTDLRGRNSGATSPEKSASDVKETFVGVSDWKSWTDFTLEFGGLPPDTKVADIFGWLSHEGELSRIDIFGRDTGTELVKAKVAFATPPKRDFDASRRYDIKHQGRRWTVPIDRFYGWNDKRMQENREYPRHIVLHPHSLVFGVPLGKARMKEMKTFQAISGRPFHLELKTFDENRHLVARFFIPVNTGSLPGSREFKFLVPVSQMKSVYHTDHNDGTASLVLPLSLPPDYYWRNTSAMASKSADTRAWRSADSWYRATDVVANFNATQFHPIAIHNDIKDPDFTAIGRWTTMKFIVESRTAALQHLRLALEDSNIGFIDCPQYAFEPSSKAPIWDLLDDASASASSALALLESASQVVHLEFPVRYQLEVCVSKGHLNEHLITREFLETLAGLDSTRARFRLEYLVDQEVMLEDPMELFSSQEAEAYYHPNRLPHYCTLVRKAIITPTTVRFSTPVAETSNRVVRKYNLVQDRFLRVQFLDEAEKGKLGFRATNEAIYERMMRTMFQGIKIGDRRYEFLAFGSSQLRECGAYFFCPTDTISCDDIRQWMGQFDHIKNVAKYAARLGQCFSTTREIRGIPSPQIRMVPDIERNGYCFSDGVGIISNFLARIIIEEMVLDVFDKPSAFQIRMGGCKGVLTVWPQAKGMEVHIRPSQEKFKAQFQALEVVKCSKVATATLNRQTIVILECLGVQPRVFLNLLDRHLARFQKSMTDKAEAIELLTQFVDENQTTLTMAELLKANFLGEATKELFVDSILSLWRAWSVKLIKEKARIHVEQSAFVLGVVDETATLRGHFKETKGSREKDPNKLPQIFLQLSDPKVYNKTTIIKGVCIVGRNPSLHPGDIRVVQAVDDPNLRHLRDVVVFPSTGDRPVPNMLSGGDLDGDDFFVIWDKSLVPWEWNHPPMNYSGPTPRTVESVTVDNLREFFVSYQKNDVLGLVASSHLGYADARHRGPKDEKCLQLAGQHSDAVDFPKTGVPVNWKGEKQKWPHFMAKSQENSYRSHKTLGKLYDTVCRQSAKMEFHTDWEDDFDPRVLKRYTLNDEILQTVAGIKMQYDISVRRILSQHSLDTEFELWTGFAMSRPAAGSDYKRSEDLGREYDVLKSRFREICYETAGGHTPEKIDPFVAAMYKVTEEQVKTALQENQERTEAAAEEDEAVKGSRRLDSTTMPLITFPWLFPWVMIRIAMGSQYNPKKSVLAPARRNVQLPVYKDGSKGSASETETTNAEAKPSEALDIAARDTAEPSTADDAAGVSMPGQSHDHRQDAGSASAGDPLYKGPNTRAELTLAVGKKKGSPMTPDPVLAQTANGVRKLSIDGADGHDPYNKAACKDNIDIKVDQAEQHNGRAVTAERGGVGNGHKGSANEHTPQDSDCDSDSDSDTTVEGNKSESLGDMMDRLARWGE